MSIRITRDLSAPMRHRVQVRGHEFTVDMSAAEGGEDAGPDPHDLYDAALGACKALTVLWYAKRKGLPLTDIEVVVERDNSQERAGVYGLHAALELGGDLTPQQRDQLLAVAARCPVHKLMTEVQTQVTTEWATPHSDSAAEELKP